MIELLQGGFVPFPFGDIPDHHLDTGHGTMLVADRDFDNLEPHDRAVGGGVLFDILKWPAGFDHP